MKLELLKERETPLLSRKRVTLSASYEGATPARKELRKSVAKKVSADEKLVILKHIYTRFGQHKAKVIAHVYEDEKAMNKLEEEYLLKKHREKKEEKKEEGGEAKPEEKKEEPKAEEAKPIESPAEAVPEDRKEKAKPAEEAKLAEASEEKSE
jgi:small subunit ribosomal protein S24e